MAFAAEMRAFACKVTSLLRSELDLGFLAFLYVVRLDIKVFHLEAMGYIDAMQHQDNWFASLESDRVWVVGKSLGSDFNSTG